MKKTKWAAMAAALLFLVSAYLGTSPALARYLNSEQYFITHAAENRSLTVEVGQTGAGNFLTSDGAAFLVAASAGSPLPFTFTNDGSDAKVIRITSTTALGSSADEVFILNPSKSEDSAQTVTDPVVSGTVSKYEKSHTIDWTLNSGTYTVTIAVFDAKDVTITDGKEESAAPGSSGEDGGSDGTTAADPSAQLENPDAPVSNESGEGSVGESGNNNGVGDGSEGDTTPATPSNPITPAEDNKVSIEDTAVPCLTLRAVFIVQTKESVSAVTVAPLLTITGNEHSINDTNQLSVAADAAVSGFAYSVQRYVELEQKGEEVDTDGNSVITKFLRWQTIELTATEEGTTEIPAIKGFTAELKEKTLTLTNAESQAPAGLYRLVIDLKDTEGFPLYVPFLVNYRQPVLQDAQEETPTVVI